nr:ABC transporter permease [uncultured Dethiosulfovibrio sp.]
MGFRSLWLKFAIPVGIVAVWAGGSYFQVWNSYVIPPPSRVLSSMWSMTLNGSLVGHLYASSLRVVGGFLIAASLAIPLGFALGLSRPLEVWLKSTLDFLRHVPPLAIMPMVILWFGIGETSKVVVVFMATFFPILLNTQGGVAGCDPKLMEVGKAFGLSRKERFSRILVPSALPSILLGMRLGLSYSWRSLIGAELIAAASGIGYVIHDAEQLSRSDVIIVGVLLLGIAGSLSDRLFSILSRRLAPWSGGNIREL